jgi:hypothetical protein
MQGRCQRLNFENKDANTYDSVSYGDMCQWTAEALTTVTGGFEAVAVVFNHRFSA